MTEAWRSDGSRDSVWVIGDHVVQRGENDTVLLDGVKVDDPLALSDALRVATHPVAVPQALTCRCETPGRNHPQWWGRRGRHFAHEVVGPQRVDES